MARELRRSEHTAPRVAMVGGFGGGNHGNEASLDVALRALRSAVPTARAAIVTPTPHDAEVKYRLPIISFNRALTHSRTHAGLRRVVRAVIEQVRGFRDIRRVVRGADLVLIPGTGFLDDFEEKPWGMPLAVFLWSYFCKWYGTALAFYAIGVGPIRNPINRFLMIGATHAATEISVRDERSLQYLQGHGGARKATVTHDIVFGADLPEVPEPRLGERLRVGVGVMAYGGWSSRWSDERYERYVDMLTEVTRCLLERGDTVVFLVGQDVDEDAVNRIRRRLPDHVLNRVERPSIQSYSGLLDAVATTDLVVATRFHNVVAALSLSRMVVSLGYAPKNADLLSTLGLRNFDQAVDEADASWVIARVEDIRAGRQKVDERAAQLLLEWRRRTNAELAELYGRYCGDRGEVTEGQR